MSKSNDEDLEKALEEFERKNFAVEVKPDVFSKNITVMTVTHNGSQWYSLRFNNPKEIIIAIEALKDYLSTLSCCQHCGSDNPRCQCWDDA